MEPRHYVFAGGGTGGHLYPGLAVAAELARRKPAARITFFTTQRPLDSKLLAPTGFEQRPQPVLPFRTNPLYWPAFWRRWRQSVAQAIDFLRDHDVTAVLGLGGYAAGPPVVAAQKLGLRRAILNPDAIPGKANRYLARRVDCVICQWALTQRHLPPGCTSAVLGCPIRAAFATAEKAAGRAHFKLDEHHPVLLVTGASQGARTINQALMRAWPEFHRAHPEWQLLHLSGPADEDAVRSAYAEADVPATVLSFTHEMPLALAAADAVVARAGASTLAELTALGLPSILLPYPYHRDQHQRVNAEVLADQGAAILVDDARDAVANAAQLLPALERLASGEARRAMAAAAGALGRPEASGAVAAWLAEND